MGEDCCNQVNKVEIKHDNKNLKRVIQIALVLNLTMFFVEFFYGVISNSLSLKADAIDFLGDSANYFITLFVLNSALLIRARASLLKAASMLAFGLWVLAEGLLKFNSQEVPDASIMSWVGILALVVNVAVAIMLYQFRKGDSNMQSVWLCSRNDAIGNVAVVLASVAVFYSASKWPDLLVAFFMAILAIKSAIAILKLARAELSSLK
jgi:Co/Zn/Cd efflux system component